MTDDEINSLVRIARDCCHYTVADCIEQLRKERDDVRRDVYIVEGGEFSDRGIDGVFSTLEKAIASHPDVNWKKYDAAEYWYADSPSGDRRLFHITKYRIDQA